MALVICSCSCNVENQQSSAVAEQSQQPQVYRANVLRVQHIIESLAHSSCSRTIVLLDDGNIFSAVDEYNEDVALLREGDEVTYTKRSNSKVDRSCSLPLSAREGFRRGSRWASKETPVPVFCRPEFSCSKTRSAADGKFLGISAYLQFVFPVGAYMIAMFDEF